MSLKLQTMPPGSHLCTLYSVAMIMRVPAQHILDELKIDPNTKPWPHLPEPMCYRGVSIDELQDFCFTRGRVLAQINVLPAVIPKAGCEPVNVYDIDSAIKRFAWYLEPCDSIITGINVNGHRHTVACSKDGQIFDPIGEVRHTVKLSAESCHLLCKIVR